jgi:hypothetical protein
MRQRQFRRWVGAYGIAFRGRRSRHSPPSYAVSGNRKYRTFIVLNVPPERCARELEVAEAFDGAYFAIRLVGSSRVGIGEVGKPATEMHVAFQQSGHRTEMNVGLRDCEHLAQPDDSAKRDERQQKNVETRVEYLPRPRRWARKLQLHYRANCGRSKPGLTASAYEPGSQRCFGDLRRPAH